MVGEMCVGFLGLLAWWLLLMANGYLQSAAPILALLQGLRETKRPFAKGAAEAVRVGHGKNTTTEQRPSWWWRFRGRRTSTHSLSVLYCDCIVFLYSLI
jgi:hypothetical protein